MKPVTVSVALLSAVAVVTDVPCVAAFSCLPGPNPVSTKWRIVNGPGSASPPLDGCTTRNIGTPWAMLRSYRSGGIERIHWKYTNDYSDRECLQGWTYYGADGTTFLGYVERSITTLGDSRPWCALPVYRDGGVRGYQWDYCRECGGPTMPDPPGGPPMMIHAASENSTITK